eukprot:760381-Hanusia_phi.AAC.4
MSFRVAKMTVVDQEPSRRSSMKESAWPCAHLHVWQVSEILTGGGASAAAPLLIVVLALPPVGSLLSTFLRQRLQVQRVPPRSLRLSRAEGLDGVFARGTSSSPASSRLILLPTAKFQAGKLGKGVMQERRCCVLTGRQPPPIEKQKELETLMGYG